MKLVVNYKKSPELKETESDAQTTVNIIVQGIISAYPNLNGEGGTRRTFGRLQRKLDDFLEADEGTPLEIESAEVDMIKKGLKSEYPATWAKFVNDFEDAFYEAQEATTNGKDVKKPESKEGASGKAA